MSRRDIHRNGLFFSKGEGAICPHCGSDNTKIADNKYTKLYKFWGYWLVGGFVLSFLVITAIIGLPMVLIGFVPSLYYTFKWKKEDKKNFHHKYCNACKREFDV